MIETMKAFRKGSRTMRSFMNEKAAQFSDNQTILLSAPAETALGQLRSIAEDIQKRDGSTFQAAYARAILANPRLYTLYLEEAGKEA